MADLLTKVLGWALSGVFFLGLISFVLWVIRGFRAMLSQEERIKVYYDDLDHSKGYYYIRKPGGTYSGGYPREQIVKEMETYERLKYEQKAKSRGRSTLGSGHTLKKPRPMWLQILLMTPAEYMLYRRRKKEAEQRQK